MFDGLMSSMGFRSRKKALASPLAGRVLPLQEVQDDTFSTCILGEGVAVEPTGNRVVAPADARVVAIFPTGHAVALRTVDGFDVLIHIGIDTVKLQGRHFKVRASQGQDVKRGDVLIEFDREAIRAEGYDIIVPVLLRNVLEYSVIRGCEGDLVEELDPLLAVRVR